MDGVNSMNEKGLIHGDIKLSNIIAKKDDDKCSTRVVDFDTVREKEDFELPVRLGSPRYIPPEGILIPLGAKFDKVYQVIGCNTAAIGKLGKKIEGLEKLKIKYSGEELEQLNNEINRNKMLLGQIETVLDRAKLVKPEIDELEGEEETKDFKSEVDSKKYDVFSFGVMLKDFMETFKKEVSDEIKEELNQLSLDMRKGLARNRIIIDQAIERLNEIQNKLNKI